MSGGYFDYNQYRINDIIDQINRLVQNNDNTEVDQFGDPVHQHFEPEIIDKFKTAVVALQRASIMVQRIDWLVSGDDSEKSFHERWDEELTAL